MLYLLPATMVRPLRLRLFGALLAAIYIAIPGGAAGVRPCPHHTGAPAAAAQHAPDAVHGEHDQHAADAGHLPDSDHAPDADHAGHSDGHHGSESGCSCLDSCTAPVAVLPIVAQREAARPTGFDPAGPRPAADSPHVTQPDHFHPFPNAPPALPV